MLQPRRPAAKPASQRRRARACASRARRCGLRPRLSDTASVMSWIWQHVARAATRVRPLAIAVRQEAISGVTRAPAFSFWAWVPREEENGTQRGSAQQGIIVSTRCENVSMYMCVTRARRFYAFGFACAFPLLARPRSYFLPRVLSCAPAFYEPCPTYAWQDGSRARALPPSSSPLACTLNIVSSFTAPPCRILICVIPSPPFIAPFPTLAMIAHFSFP